MQRSSVRISKADQIRIRKRAAQMGISQEKYIAWLLDQTEAGEGGVPKEGTIKNGEVALQNGAGEAVPLQDSAIEGLVVSQDGTGKDMPRDLKKSIRLLYRIIRTVCPLTEEDAEDPDFGIGLADVYEDKNRHPEKYQI